MENNKDEQVDVRIVKTVKKLKTSSNNTPNAINKINKELFSANTTKQNVHISLESQNKLPTMKNIYSVKSSKINIEEEIQKNLNSSNKKTLEKLDKQNVDEINNNTSNLPFLKSSSMNPQFQSKSSIRDKSDRANSVDKMLNFKEKNDYQKKLTNQLAIDKYKLQCLQILKDDDEIKNLVEVTKIPDLGKFIEDYFFSDISFMFKLEIFLLHQNGNTKNKKNTFFKKELQKVLEYKKLDLLFEEKMNSVISSLDNQFKIIENFKIN